MVAIAALPHEVTREALRALGETAVPVTRSAAARRLRELFATVGVVRELLDRAPAPARDCFVRVAHDGPTAVEDVLGRGWWGHGALPKPLDWAQRRALIAVGEDGLVHAVAEARTAFLDLTLDLGPLPPAASAPAGPAAAHGRSTQGAQQAQEALARVEPVRTVVVAPTGVLDRALSAGAARLRLVAPTVAVSDRGPAAVRAALRSAGVPLAVDAVVAADPAAPALPAAAEEAVGPRALRVLLARALEENRQVRLQYFASSRGGAATERVVDPWSFTDDLLRGWCHLRTDERTFALDRVGRATLLPSPVEHPAPTR